VAALAVLAIGGLTLDGGDVARTKAKLEKVYVPDLYDHTRVRWQLWQ
jgi:hypothetical protein